MINTIGVLFISPMDLDTSKRLQVLLDIFECDYMQHWTEDIA